MKTEFIHYGSTSFEPAKFRPVKNNDYAQNKPKHGTGFWASPVKSSYGWKDWCQEENFRDCNDNNSFNFTLSDDCRILTIDERIDLDIIPTIDNSISSSIKGIDFEKLSKSFDAIFLTENGQWKTRHSYPLGLYGWDCECILILNEGVIIPSYSHSLVA